MSRRRRRRSGSAAGVLGAVRSWLPWASGRRCPACGEETMRGEPPFLFGAIRLLPAQRVNYRWCRRCSWKGVALVTPLPPQQPPRPVRPFETPPPATRPAAPADAVRVKTPRPPGHIAPPDEVRRTG